MILLDTNVVVWLFNGDPQLGFGSRNLIEQARADEGISFSAITAWEISMLVEKGRLSLGRDTIGWIEAALAAPGMSLAEISPAIAIKAGQLPRTIHGDPADRLIIATAQAGESRLLTTDRKILAYADQGHVQAIDARL